MTFGILASGNLGAVCLSKLIGQKKINFVMTDKKSTGIIEICNHNNIPCFAGNPRNNAAAIFLKQFITDVILSVNYLFIVEKDILLHPKRYAINFHGSLLPRYRGRTPHVWAIINNEQETGVTAHLMTEGCDEGDIVMQEKIKIGEHTTGAEILTSFVDVYPLFIKKVIESIENNQIQFIKQDDSKATYFGKRTPEDGKIDWNWQKERIRNWVRAQANPYPGAFTFYQNTKVVIDKIEYSDYGFHFEDQNGKILTHSDNELIVKTPNGAVKIVSWNSPEEINFKTGENFHG